MTPRTVALLVAGALFALLVIDGFFRRHARYIEDKCGGLWGWLAVHSALFLTNTWRMIWELFFPPPPREPVVIPADGGDGGDIVISSGTGGRPGKPDGKPGKPGRLKLIIGAGGGDGQQPIMALCIDPKDNTVTVWDKKLPMETVEKLFRRLLDEVQQVQ